MQCISNLISRCIVPVLLECRPALQLFINKSNVFFAQFTNTIYLDEGIYRNPPLIAKVVNGNTILFQQMSSDSIGYLKVAVLLGTVALCYHSRDGLDILF